MQGKPSIAFVCPRFAEGGTVGGAETLLKNLAARAAGNGFPVTFLTTCARNHFTWTNERPAGVERHDRMQVRFFAVDSNRDVDTFLSVQQAISRGRSVSLAEQHAWLASSVNSRDLCDHLRDHGDDYDLIIVGPYLFGLSYAAASIHPARTVMVPCLHDEPFAYLEVFGELLPRLRGIMFNSEPERELGLRLYGLESRRTAVVGMGLDAFDADADRFRRNRAISGDYVMYAGRREPLKGTPMLLDYMAAFRARTGRHVKLLLTGSGPLETPPELQPHVIDLGFVSEQDKHDAMAGAAAFCHPSVNESLGIVLLEAWMAGTCVLAHGSGAVLKDQCRRSGGGLWFTNYPQFEESLERIMAHQELRAVLASQGRRYVLREYSWRRIDEKFSDALVKFGSLIQPVSEAIRSCPSGRQSRQDA